MSLVFCMCTSINDIVYILGRDYMNKLARLSGLSFSTDTLATRTNFVKFNFARDYNMENFDLRNNHPSGQTGLKTSYEVV